MYEKFIGKLDENLLIKLLTFAIVALGRKNRPLYVSYICVCCMCVRISYIEMANIVYRYYCWQGAREIPRHAVSVVKSLLLTDLLT